MSSPSPKRTVLVTGAAKRRGRDIALALAQDGWQVAVHYRDSLEDAIKTVADCTRLAGASAAFRANLANEAAVRQLLPSVINEFGHVDAIVHSASTFEHDTAANFHFASMEKHMRCNAGAIVLLAQALHAHITARHLGAEAAHRPIRGVVINLLAQAPPDPAPDLFSYALSKAALETANTLLARGLSPQIRVVGLVHDSNPALTSEVLAALNHD